MFRVPILGRAHLRDLPVSVPDHQLDPPDFSHCPICWGCFLKEHEDGCDEEDGQCACSEECNDEEEHSRCVEHDNSDQWEE
jgi:hypothetical protein